jgi:hypothetical protein
MLIMFSIYFLKEQITISDSYRFLDFSFSTFPINNKPADFGNCNLCSFSPSEGDFIPDSSSRDAIFCLAINYLTNLVPFARALRTTGSKCRLIIFGNTAAINSSPETVEEAKRCGVEFVDIGSPSLKGYGAVYYYKYLVLGNFLIQYKNLFDRVYFCDLYDTIIQHDPFITSFNKQAVIFSNEGYTIGIRKSNVDFVNGALGNINKVVPNLSLSKEYILRQYILNGGLQAGTTNDLINFCLEMRKIGDPNSNYAYAIDQGFINVLVYSGYFKSHFNYIIEAQDSNILSTIGIAAYSYDANGKETTLGKFNVTKCMPGVIHQYDRCPSMVRKLKEFCPNDKNLPHYTRR